MKKYFVISIVLISIFLIGCGRNNLEQINSEEQSRADLKNSSSTDTEKDIIKIYSTEENKMIRKIIDVYNTKYPDIKIEYLIGNSEKNHDVLKEMLEKEGPDMVIPDFFLEEELLKNDLLLNLNNGINLENNIPNFRENYNEYIIPLRFSIPFLFTKFGTHNFTISQIVEKPEEFQVSNMTYDEFIEFLYLYYDNELVDENNSINETNLTEFIKNIIIIADKQNIINEKMNEDDFFMIKNYLLGKNTIMFRFAMGVDDIKYYLSATAMEKGKAVFVEDSIMPYTKIVINKNSRYINECMDFIEIGLSYDIQKIDFDNGFPVNEKALDEWANTYVVSDDEVSIELENSTDVKIDDPPAEEIKTMIGLIKELPNIYIRDMKLLSLIQEESKKYYNEEASLEQTTENIVKRYTE